MKEAIDKPFLRAMKVMKTFKAPFSVLYFQI